MCEVPEVLSCPSIDPRPYTDKSFSRDFISMSLFDRITCQAIRLGSQVLAARRIETSVTGLEHIPMDGPVLLVARHYHHLFDGVVLLLSLPRPIHILVTLDWATNNYARLLMTQATALASWPVVERSDCLRVCGKRERTCKRKILRASSRRQRSALTDSVALLAQGRVLVVFPEGYPNIDPRYTPKTRPEEFLPFRTGFAAIAAAAEKRLDVRVPIVPSGLHYTKNNRWIVRLNIGQAVYLGDFVSRQLLVRYVEQRVVELSRLP